MGTLQKGESFPLRTSSVNVTKSLIENFIFCAVGCVFHFFFFFVEIFIMVEEYEKLDQERKVVRKKKHFSINYNYKPLNLSTFSQ